MLPYLEAIRSVTGPLTLVAFIAVVVLAIYRRSVKDQRGLEYLHNLIAQKTTRETFYDLAKTIFRYMFWLAVILMMSLLVAWLVPILMAKPPQQDHVSNSAPKLLEISSLSFSEPYENESTTGMWPQFDLKMRNNTGETVFVTGLRFNVKNVWRLEPTALPVSKPTAEVKLPSAIYDVEIGRNDDKESDKPVILKDGDAVDFNRSAFGNKEPEIKTRTKAISHEIRHGDTERIIVNYRIIRQMRFQNPSDGQISKHLMITPFYVLKLSVSVIYNNGNEVESGDLLFAHYYSSRDKVAFVDPPGELNIPGVKQRSVRIAENRDAITAINFEKARIPLCSKSVSAVIETTEELAGK